MATKNETKIIVEKGKQELFIIREFEAPREIVFRAFSEQELLTQWAAGPNDMTVRYEKFEPYAGGSYRFVNTIPGNAMEFAFHGVCHEHTAPERIIQTFEFEGLPEKGHVILETSRFEDLPAAGPASRFSLFSNLSPTATAWCNREWNAVCWILTHGWMSCWKR
jgi:uncharacterized protein YndB with AHSA1/START domain